MKTGDQVYDKADPRHVGTIKLIERCGSVGTAKVQWNETGWVSYVKLPNLVLSSDVPEAHNFTGTLEDWEHRVVMTASAFRIHRFTGNKVQDEAASSDNLGYALLLALEGRKRGWRVLVYAVTTEGRSVCIPEKHWEHYASLWLQQRGTMAAVLR